MSEERVPIWEYRPRDDAERRRKYKFAIKNGLSRSEAYQARDWDWPRIEKVVKKKRAERGLPV